jgi:hypothetical protein
MRVSLRAMVRQMREVEALGGNSEKMTR